MPKELVETKLAQDLGECYMCNTDGGVDACRWPCWLGVECQGGVEGSQTVARRASPARRLSSLRR